MYMGYLYGVREGVNWARDFVSVLKVGWCGLHASPLCWFNNKKFCVLHVQSNTTILGHGTHY